MKTQTNKLPVLMMLFAIVASLSCIKPGSKFSSPNGYDLNNPEKFLMPDDLLEISGMAFHQLHPDTVYSIQDEDGHVFMQHWGVKRAVNTKFASKGDYEDLATLGDSMFIMKSNGSFYGFPISEIGKKVASGVKEWKKLLPKGEYESMYADDAASQLYVLCKNCDVDKKKDQVTGYVLAYDPATASLTQKETFTVDTKLIKASGHKVEHGLRASALGRNPVTNDWYIVSSVNKMLVVADSKWTIKDIHRLDSGIFNQPEGIAFDQDQTLYISNEGDEITNGNILKFRYSNSKK
jgi:hypothetical protein